MIRKIQKVHVLWFVGVAITIGLLSLVWFVPQYQAKKARERASAAINNLDPKEQPKERLQLEKDFTTAENSARTTIAQILGGLVLLSGLYFTYRNLKITEDGKLTDRFSKAVELLGNDKLDIRLGGIYALERLARDSRNDHWTIMEVLTAYVREHSKREETKDNVKKEDEKVNVLPKILADVQAILDVIGRRKWSDSESKIINLFQADLRGADLSGANLSRANLRGANLSRANLTEAYLSGATLTEANLSGANLSRANLTEAYLRGAELSGAYLVRADLSRAHLSRANLSGAYLTEAYLTEAYLTEANLRGAELSRAELRGAELSRADLRGAGLSRAELRGAELSRARNLTWEQISGASINSETRLPTDFEEMRNAKSEDAAPFDST